MDLIKIHFGKGMESMRDQMEQVIDEMLHLSRACVPRTSTCWAPPADIYETEEEIIILMEMAGLKKEDIEVFLDQGILRVSGRRANPIQDTHLRVHQLDVDFGPFERMIRIKVPVDPEKTSAIYQEGFLVIRVRKAAPLKSDIRVEERPR
jgi:HSP20 family protein